MARLSFCYLFLYCLVLIASTDLHAQFSLADTLPQVLVSESRLPLARVGRRAEVMDSAGLVPFLGQSMGEALLYAGQFQIRNNGIGLSTTSGMRGGSGTQTAVLWNGINIQNPTLGLTDLSMLYTGFIDMAQVEYGGSAALWGNGSVGGTIHLRSDKPYGEGLGEAVDASFGSFTRGHGALRLSYGSKNFTSVTRAFLRGGRNDFPFDSSGVELTRMHARTRQWGIMQENSLLVARDHELGLHIWYQEGYREVPGTISFPSEATQDDQVFRALADYTWSGNPIGIQGRIGYTQDRIWYKLPAFMLSADNAGEQVIAEIEGIWNAGPVHELRLGLNNTWMRGRSNSYTGQPTQNRTALFAAWTWRSRNDRLQANISLRQEMVDGTLVPFVPSAGLTAKLTDWFAVKAAVSRNYKLPVLDDLYFSDAFSQADPTLEAEQGWSEEIGLMIVPESLGPFQFTFQTTFFNRNVDNWIVWIPDTNFVFSPRNIREVWSRGLENELRLGYTAGDFSVHLQLRYDWIRSTIEADADPVLTVGNELPYVPEHKLTGAIGLGYRGVLLTYRHNYTDMVFADDINTVGLDAFHLGRLTLAYNFNMGFGPIRLFGEIDNVWDADYQLVNGYPQPGRMFRAGFSLKLP